MKKKEQRFYVTIAFFCSDQLENIVSKAPLSFMKNSSDSSVKSYVFGLPLIVRVTLKLGEFRNETKKNNNYI